MLYSLEVEKQFLAGLIQHPEAYSEICDFISEVDFYSEDTIVHKTIYHILKKCIESNEKADEIIIAQRIKEIGISFKDNIDIFDYLRSLAVRKTNKNTAVLAAKEVKKYSIRRSIHASALEVAEKMKKIAPDSSYQTIIEEADTTFNKIINIYENNEEKPVNIFEEMESVVEERGNNPITEFGLMGPFPTVNKIYGSLLRPGNITVIVARSGVGKTLLALNYTTKVSAQYDVPVLHFDNGEMSKEEVIMRQCAALSHVPMHLLETGLWRKAGEDVVERVRSTWKKIKNLKFYYYNVGGMTTDQMVNNLKRFYYSKIGRGNQMIFSFDYIKPSADADGNKPEWQVIGDMLNRFKKTIQRDIVQDQKPMISMFTSIQSNRAGISTNRNSDAINDDESIVSMSDRITHYCSHMAILRPKTADERQEEGPSFGSHKLIFVKNRFLGADVAGAVELVRLQDGTLKKNFINLQFENFDIKERGDLRDIVNSIDTGQTTLERNREQDDVPNFNS
jgi:replicative DNA helicase